MKMKYDKTGRGFTLITFDDRYQCPCEIQDSSLATEAAIWLGCVKPPQVLKDGQWQDCDMSVFGRDVVEHNRMHLTQEQVEKLIPILKHFVDTGYLPESQKEITF